MKLSINAIFFLLFRGKSSTRKRGSRRRYLTYCILHFKMLLRKLNELTAVTEGVSDLWLSADMPLSPFCSSKIPKRMFFLSLWMRLWHMHPVVKILLLTKTVWIAVLHRCMVLGLTASSTQRWGNYYGDSNDIVVIIFFSSSFPARLLFYSVSLFFPPAAQSVGQVSSGEIPFLEMAYTCKFTRTHTKRDRVEGRRIMRFSANSLKTRTVFESSLHVCGFSIIHVTHTQSWTAYVTIRTFTSTCSLLFIIWGSYWKWWMIMIILHPSTAAAETLNYSSMTIIRFYSTSLKPLFCLQPRQCLDYCAPAVNIWEKQPLLGRILLHWSFLKSKYWGGP